MNEVEIRLECLKLACALEIPPDYVIETAQKLLSFIHDFIQDSSASSPSETP